LRRLSGVATLALREGKPTLKSPAEVISFSYTSHKCAFCGGKTDENGRVVEPPKQKSAPRRPMGTQRKRLSAWARG
jgi:hypothetical protein